MQTGRKRVVLIIAVAVAVVLIVSGILAIRHGNDLEQRMQKTLDAQHERYIDASDRVGNHRAELVSLGLSESCANALTTATSAFAFSQSSQLPEKVVKQLDDVKQGEVIMEDSVQMWQGISGDVADAIQNEVYIVDPVTARAWLIDSGSKQARGATSTLAGKLDMYSLKLSGAKLRLDGSATISFDKYLDQLREGEAKAVLGDLKQDPDCAAQPGSSGQDRED